MRRLSKGRALGVVALVCVLCGCDREEARAGQVEQRQPESQSADPAVAGARAALNDGLGWTASLRIAPALADTARRTPEAVLIAATAASRWNGWTQVRDLLQGKPWLDTLFEARGRELLARAALQQRDFTTAVVLARMALEHSASDEDEAVRTVLLARSHDGSENPDSARILYLRAAESVPTVADWLRLRAMVYQPDSAERRKHYSELTIPAALERVRLTEARADLWEGDTAAAIGIQEELGRDSEAAGLRLAIARSREDSIAVRDSMLARLSRTGRPPSGLIDLLTLHFDPLSAEAELAVARKAATYGPVSRAVSGFERAFQAGLGNVRDRYLYANALARLDRYDEAAEQYGRVTSGDLAPDAAYLRARSILRAGDLEGSRTALRRILSRYPKESASVIARVLLADLAIDEGRDADARATLLDAAGTAPSSSLTPGALFSAAIIAYAHDQPRTAAREFDDLFDRYPGSDAAIAARYWAGRAWATAGDSATARSRWADTRERFPYTYYATRSGLRLGIPLEIPARDTTLIVPDDDVNETMARIALLESLGMGDEAQIETSELVRSVGQSTSELLAAAAAFLANGQAAQSLRLASRALGRGAPTDTATYRLLFPVLEEGGLRSLAREHDVRPALVAGLIRQESSFNPQAHSPAGARGLMQIMPSLGERMAETLNYPVWDPVLLYQPSVSLQMGIQHLSGLVRDYNGNLPRVLAAYNAGASRVERWKEREGAEDPELFTERIPYRETRNYVRLVLRNMEIYQALYGWEPQ